MTVERFTGHYDAWTESRLEVVLSAFGPDAFRGRTVLDIGGGSGHLAQRLLELGARSVEVVEGRLANIAASADVPGLSFTHANLERGLLSARDAYDVVVNFGVIYHLANWEPLLVQSLARARELVLIETEVVDSDTEATRYVVEDDLGYDQSMSGVGSRPSEFEIDRILSRFPNASAAKLLDPRLNAEFHRYDWPNELEGRVEDGLRRFWAVERVAEVEPAVERLATELLLREIHHAKTVDQLVITRRGLHALERKLDEVLEAVRRP